MMFTITYYEQPLINVSCLKFMSCVGQVSIDYLSIDQQCHIMISCKHDAMLSLAYQSLFLDKLTTSMSQETDSGSWAQTNLLKLL